MTQDELLDLIGDQPLTTRLALELSIKKWENVMNHWYDMMSLSRIFTPHTPNVDNCALCIKYLHREGLDDEIIRKYPDQPTELCPLNRTGDFIPCDGECNRVFSKWMEAYLDDDETTCAWWANKMVELLKDKLQELDG